METKKLPLLQRISPWAPLVDKDQPACLVELRYSPYWKESAWDGDPEAEANVEFICEAFETAKKSGMTPAEMWKRLQYVEGLMDKFERHETSFAKKCEKALTLIKNNWIYEHGNREVGEAWGALELFLTGKIE